MHCSHTIARLVAGLALMLPAGAMAQGQQGSGSPYSAYGFGELTGSVPMAQAMMGGLGAAVIDPASMVYANPASYPSLFRTTFEMGLGVRSSQLSSNTYTRNGRNTDLYGLSLGIPFANGRWGLGIVVRPMSKVNYLLKETAAIPGSSSLATFTYAGDGGLDQALVGVGHVLSQQRDSLANGHRLSIGANVGYLFGRIERSRTAVFPSGQGFYATRALNTLVIRDPTVDAGLQYQGDLRKKRSKEDRGLYFLAGLNAELPVNIRARRTDVVNTYGFSASGIEVPLDTAYFVGNETGTWTLPLGLGAGFTVFTDRWTVGVEYRQRAWSGFKVSEPGFAPSGSLANSSAIIAGGSFVPSNEILASFWKRIAYRAGFRMENEYLKVGGTQLSGTAASVGMSVPLMPGTTRSRFNIGCEIGQRGTQSDGLLRERYATLLLGVSITPDLREGWFRKRRID